MSSTGPSDPRLLLPEWLRDGDLPAPAKVEAHSPEAADSPPAYPLDREIAEMATMPPGLPGAGTLTPYSHQLSLDTRLDPGQLVSADDLPTWLGGLDHPHALTPIESSNSPATRGIDVPPAQIIEEPEPYEGIDAPDEGVIDVEINGWLMVAGAIGLLILLAAALRLYLS